MRDGERDQRMDILRFKRRSELPETEPYPIGAQTLVLQLFVDMLTISLAQCTVEFDACVEKSSRLNESRCMPLTKSRKKNFSEVRALKKAYCLKRRENIGDNLSQGNLIIISPRQTFRQMDVKLLEKCNPRKRLVL